MHVYMTDRSTNRKTMRQTEREVGGGEVEERMEKRATMVRLVPAANDDRHGGVVSHVVADAAQEGALDLAVTARAAHDHARALVVGCLDDGLPRLALALPDFPLYL